MTKLFCMNTDVVKINEIEQRVRRENIFQQNL